MSELRHLNKTTNNNVIETGEKELKKENEQLHSQKNVENSNKSDSSMIYVVFVSLLFDLLAFTIILPLLPSLLEYYRINDSSGLYNVLTQRIHWFQQLLGAPERFTSVLFGGFLGSMFSFLQFVASPIVGGLSDYYGRKPILLICAVSIRYKCTCVTQS